jgi:hypothetical protein
MEAKEKFIRDRQADFQDVSKMQEWIDEGIAWSMEGANRLFNLSKKNANVHMTQEESTVLLSFLGREAMRGLESGKYFLPNESQKDYYGNHIPSREQVKEGTKGSLSNSYDFYQDKLFDKLDDLINEF